MSVILKIPKELTIPATGMRVILKIPEVMTIPAP